LKLNLEGNRFSDEQTTVVYHIFQINKALIDKNAPEKFCIIIIQVFERIHTERFYIKTKRPSLKVQKGENYFALFSKMGGSKNKFPLPTVI
jgi:hypothetical protein